MKAYREDQGRLARMGAFWALALLLLFGCTYIHDVLYANFKDALGDPLGGIKIPVVGVELTGAFLITLGLFLVGMIWLDRYTSRPKVADLLIETEGELRKVTWPTSQEVVNSSLVVVVSVVFIGAFLAGCDYVLGRLMKYLVLGHF